MVTQKIHLAFEAFRLDNITISGLPNYLWGNDAPFDSDIEKEPYGELCDWYNLRNTDNEDHMQLIWEGSYYTLRSSNSELTEKVISYIRNAYEKIRASDSGMLEGYTREGNLEKVKSLYSGNGSVYYLLVLACVGGHNSIIHYFLSQPSNSKGISKGLADGLIHACKKEHVETVKLILNHSLKIKKKHLKKSLSLSLSQATQINSLELVKILLQNGARVVLDLADYYETALHAAARYNRTEILIQLLATHCEIDPWNEGCLTPTEIAYACKNYEIIAVLEEYRLGQVINDF